MSDFKNAKWIAASKSENGPAPLFRKVFVVNKYIYIAQR